MPFFSSQPRCPDLSKKGKYEAKHRGYSLVLEDYKREAGETLQDQTSFRNLSVFNVKLRDNNSFYMRFRRYICSTDERDHTKFTNPAASVGAVFERLMTYDLALNGGAHNEPDWFDSELEKAYVHASTPPDGVAGTRRDSFRTIVNMFTPKSDTVGSVPGADQNDPNGIVNDVTQRINQQGHDFDPDGVRAVSYLDDEDLMFVWTKEWSNFESSIIWDERIFRDGLEGFRRFREGRSYRFPWRF